MLVIENAFALDLAIETVRYQYDNHLGSASLELDENAAIISYEEYHPFGTTSYRSGRSETEVSLKRYKYVGKERDEETGLYNYGFRMYAPWLGRFISVDPLQFEYPQLTPFNYAGNKPITHIDIDGLQGTGDETQKQVLKNAHENQLLEAKEKLFRAEIELFDAQEKAGTEFSESNSGANASEAIREISLKYNLENLEKVVEDLNQNLKIVQERYEVVEKEIKKVTNSNNQFTYTKELEKQIPSIVGSFKIGEKVGMLEILGALKMEISIENNPNHKVVNPAGDNIIYSNTDNGGKNPSIVFSKQEQVSIFNEIGDIFFKRRFWQAYQNDKKMIDKAERGSKNRQEAYSKVYYRLSQEKFSRWLESEAKKIGVK